MGSHAGYEADEFTGDKMYGYVSDSCPDNNYWCQTDTYHLDISRAALDEFGYRSTWNGRQISWKYISDTPSGYAL